MRVGELVVVWRLWVGRRVALVLVLDSASPAGLGKRHVKENKKDIEGKIPEQLRLSLPLLHLGFAKLGRRRVMHLFQQRFVRQGLGMVPSCSGCLRAWVILNVLNWRRFDSVHFRSELGALRTVDVRVRWS